MEKYILGLAVLGVLVGFISLAAHEKRRRERMLQKEYEEALAYIKAMTLEREWFVACDMAQSFISITDNNDPRCLELMDILLNKYRAIFGTEPKMKLA